MYRLYMIFLIVVLLASVAAVADERDITGGVQKPYLFRVPHTTADGKLLYEYDAERSFIPLGVYSIYADRFKELSEAHFNTLVYNGAERLDLANQEHRDDVISRARKYGIQIAPGFVNSVDMLKAFADEKSILTYNIIDEPNRFTYSKDDPIDPAYNTMIRWLQIVREVDPDREIWINLVPKHAFTDMKDPLQVAWWYVFNSASGIASADCYPIVSADNITEPIARTVKEQVELNQTERATWFVVQGHKDKRMPPHPDNILPTVEQYRSEIYTAIVHGATGIFTFKINEERWPMHPGIGPDTQANDKAEPPASPDGMVITEADAALSRELWKTASRINSEITGLKKVILTPTSPLDYKIFASDEKGGTGFDFPIRTLLKFVDGAYYLFVANVDSVSMSVRFEMPAEVGPIEGLTVVVGPNTGATADGYSIKDAMEPLGVRVYKFAARK